MMMAFVAVVVFAISFISPAGPLTPFIRLVGASFALVFAVMSLWAARAAYQGYTESLPGRTRKA